MMSYYSIYKRIGFNTLIQSAGRLASLVTSIVTVSLLTRYLGTDGYGNFSLVFAYMSFFSIFADFGLQLTVVREFSQRSVQEQDELMGTFFWTKLFLVMFSFMCGSLLLLFLPYSMSLKLGIFIGSLAVCIGYLSSYGSAIFQSRIRLDIVTYIDIANKLITFLLIVWFIALRLDFYFIISSVLFGNIASLIITIILVQRVTQLRFNFNHSLARKIVRQSIPIGFTSLFSIAYFKIDTLILSFTRGSTEVGIYGLAYKILENILMLWGFYMASVYPLLALYAGRRQSHQIAKLVKHSVFVGIGSSLAILIIGFIVSPFIISLLGGGAFSFSLLPLRILLFSVPFFFLDNIFYTLFLAFHKVGYALFVMAIALLINFVLNFFFIPMFGYIGASVITVVAEVCMFILYIFFLHRIKHAFVVTTKGK